jgi:ferredoxin-NADP reductase
MWEKTKILYIKNQTPDFRTIVLKPKNPKSFKPGNFIEITNHKGGPFKCYSVVSSPSEKDVIEIGVKLLHGGALSPRIFKLNQGDELLIRGPMGAFFEWEESNKTTVLLAGGSGICPMICILRSYDPSKGKVILVFSTKKDSVYYKDELERITVEKNVNYHLVLTGRDNRIDKDFLEKKFKKIIGHETEFFIAGPSAFVQNVLSWLDELGVSPENLRYDDFGS